MSSISVVNIGIRLRKLYISVKLYNFVSTEDIKWGKL